MAPEFRGEDRDWTGQYASIGQFVVEFEWISWKLRLTAQSILQMDGMREWHLGEIIFNQKFFTGYPLFECLSSMAAELLGTDEDVIKAGRKLNSQYQKLCELRNDIVHSTYLIGPSIIETTDEETPTEITVDRRPPTSSGVRRKHIASTMAEMQAHIEFAQATRALVENWCNSLILPLRRYYVNMKAD